jgi:hypothetical protein
MSKRRHLRINHSHAVPQERIDREKLLLGIVTFATALVGLVTALIKALA